MTDRELLSILQDPRYYHLHGTAACILDMRRERRRIRRRRRLNNSLVTATLALVWYFVRLHH